MILGFAEVDSPPAPVGMGHAEVMSLEHGWCSHWEAELAVVHERIHLYRSIARSMRR